MNEFAEQMCRFTCAGCQTEMMGKIPAMRIYNFPESSGCVMSHERPSKCPGCGAIYAPIIQSISSNGMMTFGWRRVSQQDTRELTGMHGLTGNMDLLSLQREIEGGGKGTT